MAEILVKVIQELAPNLPGSQVRLVYVAGTTQANNDVITVTDLTTVKGAFLISSTGTVAAMTFATNIITITNASTLIWSGIVWGT